MARAALNRRPSSLQEAGLGGDGPATLLRNGTRFHGKEPSDRWVTLTPLNTGRLGGAHGGVSQGLQSPRRGRAGSSELPDTRRNCMGPIIRSLSNHQARALEPSPRLLCHRFFGTSKTTTKIIPARAGWAPRCLAIQDTMEYGPGFHSPVDN